MTETQQTVAPGPDTYSTRKIAMEWRLLDGARGAATILRPCAVHGPHSRHPREWWFVKRLLDNRSRVPLAHEGRSRFQTSATVNMAALIAVVAQTRTSGILNAVDPAAPSVAQIGRAVMAALGREAELVPIQGAPTPVGRTPWSVPQPFVLSDAAARAIGYRSIAPYPEVVRPVCAWLAAATDDWRVSFPQLAAYPWPRFDYAAEDAWLLA